MTLCACGCGKEITVKPHHKYYKNVRYLQGHNTRSVVAHNKGKLSPLKGRPSGRKGTPSGRKGIASPLKGKPNGRKTPDSVKKKISDKIKGMFVGKNNYFFGRPPSLKTGRGKRCHYQSPLQGQVCFRSSYELAYAKYLDSIHELWMYETETFDLGDTTYTPDFFLPRQEKFIEIKGYMSEESQQKINKFNEQYTFNLEIVGLKELKQLGLK